MFQGEHVISSPVDTDSSCKSSYTKDSSVSSGQGAPFSPVYYPYPMEGNLPREEYPLCTIGVPMSYPVPYSINLAAQPYMYNQNFPPPSSAEEIMESPYSGPQTVPPPIYHMPRPIYMRNPNPDLPYDPTPPKNMGPLLNANYNGHRMNSKGKKSNHSTMGGSSKVTSDFVAENPSLNLPGPAKSALYKTRMCRNYEATHYCRYGDLCQFAHGEKELRPEYVPPTPRPHGGMKNAPNVRKNYLPNAMNQEYYPVQPVPLSSKPLSRMAKSHLTPPVYVMENEKNL